MDNALLQWIMVHRLYFIIGAVVAYSSMVCEFFLITSHKGQLKRGICVSCQPLPLETLNYMYQIQNGMRYEGWRILRENGKVLFAKRDLSRLWYLWYFPYVGYIDLEREVPMIEYRSPVSNIIIWFVLVAVTLGFPVFLLTVLLPAFDVTMHYTILGVVVGVMLFNIFLFFGAHRDEVRKLRDIIIGLGKVV